MRFRLLVLYLLLPCYAFSQTGHRDMPVEIHVQLVDKADNPEFILYNVDRYLEIKDFKGRPDMNSKGVGATFSGIRLSMEGRSFNGKMDVNVSLMVYFDKSSSWMKPEGKDERVLKHEQIHFDLTGIYACRMYHAIRNETYTSRNVKQKLRDIQNKYTAALQSEQTLYDTQTKHGTLPEAQKAWSDKVMEMKSQLDCM